MPRKIKDLPDGTNLFGVAFKHPETGETCYWRSQWGYEAGEAGVWYYNTPNGGYQLFMLHLKKLTDALEFELVEEPKETTDGKA
jgi:hypothetical protein